MIAAKDVDSPLITLLRAIDTSADLTFIGSVDAVRNLAKQAVAAAPPLPPQFQEFLKLPDLTSAVLIRVNVSGDFKASITLRATDDDAAVELEKIVDDALVIGKNMALAQMAAMPKAPGDPVAEASSKYMLRITERFFEMLKPTRTGSNLTLASHGNSSVAVVGILIALVIARGSSRPSRCAENSDIELHEANRAGPVEL